MWWIINSLGLAGAWYFTDLASESVIERTISPMMIAVFLIALLIQVVFLLGPVRTKADSSSNSSGVSGGFSDGSGGDGGF